MEHKIISIVVVCVHLENFLWFVWSSSLGLASALACLMALARSFGLSRQSSQVLTLVEENGQERDWAHVVAGGFALVLQVGLGISYVGPEVGVGREASPGPCSDRLSLKLERQNIEDFDQKIKNFSIMGKKFIQNVLK